MPQEPQDLYYGYEPIDAHEIAKPPGHLKIGSEEYDSFVRRAVADKYYNDKDIQEKIEAAQKAGKTRNPFD